MYQQLIPLNSAVLCLVHNMTVFSQIILFYFTLSLAAVLSYPPLHRKLEVWSDQPGLELYTGKASTV